MPLQQATHTGSNGREVLVGRVKIVEDLPNEVGFLGDALLSDASQQTHKNGSLPLHHDDDWTVPLRPSGLHHLRRHHSNCCVPLRPLSTAKWWSVFGQLGDRCRKLFAQGNNADVRRPGDDPSGTVHVERHFCGNCGSPIISIPTGRREIVIVKSELSTIRRTSRPMSRSGVRTSNHG